MALNARLRLLVAAPLCCYLAAHAQLQRPFDPGYAMATLGTIVWGDGPGGREPWVPAAWLDDSLRCGVALAGVSFYDRMDGGADGLLGLACAGVWYRFEQATVKVSFRQLDIMRIMTQQQGSLSIGHQFGRTLSASAELQGYRTSLRTADEQARGVVEWGASVQVPRRYATALLRVSALPALTSSTEGVGNYPCVSIGICTRRHRAGAVGTAVDIVFENEPRYRFRHGLEYRIGDIAVLSAAVQTAPFLLAFGFTIDYPSASATIALANHPLLGWSKGAGAHFTR